LLKAAAMPLLRDSPELLASFRGGDPATLSVVYRAYSTPVERYLKMLSRRVPHVPCFADIADLHQDTFERAFSFGARRAYDATRQFGPYLLTIAHHCFVDALRKARRELLDADVDVIDGQGELPRQESDRDPRIADLLERYVHGLPAPLRSTFEQRFVFGHSQAVASNELGVTRRSLRTREEHLKRGLRRALQARGLFHGDCW
jgi:RNA polymerase sigma factor (sigma-70 family)